jgi:hypothetical protein
VSLRNYLLNTSVLSSDRSALSLAVRDHGAKVVEVAECINNVPLPWLACFRTGDLQPCIVDSDVSIMVPCVDLPTAIKNLAATLPLFERLTGEKEYAREYWQHALDDLKKLPLPFLTMEVSELLSFSSADDLNTYMAASLGGTNEALDYLKDVFIAYYDGKLPYKRADFYANKGINDQERIDNTISLDAAIQEDGMEHQY